VGLPKSHSKKMQIVLNTCGVCCEEKEKEKE
jgi:hypothetical protein